MGGMNTNLTHEARQREDGEVRPSRMEQTGAPGADATHIAFILDRSGSMGSMRAEAVGGFNDFIKEHQQTTYDWQFLFLGAKFDSVQEARDLGIKRSCSYVFDSVEEGMSLSSRTIAARHRQKSKKNKKIGF